MKRIIIFICILLLGSVALVKLVPAVNDLAREELPEEVLKLIGEKPKNFIERLLD